VNAPDAAELAGVAAGVTIAGLAIGALAMRLLRGRAIATQVVALTISTVLAVTAGVYASSRAMFISEHDLTALVVVLAAAAAVGVAIALFLGHRIGRASRALVAATRQLSDGRVDTIALHRDAPAELAELARELVATQQRLDEARARQERLEGSRRELVAWVSHDLRTPLAGMRAIAEAVEDGVVDDPDTVTRYLRTMREEVDHLALLVDDLFELSRTQAGALRLHFEQVSLGDLVSDALAGAAPLAAVKGVALEGRLVGPPPELEVSAPEVLRALRNLLENAIRHTPSDGSVIVEAGADEVVADWVYVDVHDTGGGVAEEDLVRVFDVAYQRDPARTPGSGAGLGLAIAKGFVEAHAGELRVRNENGGATFTIRLPRARV
jgi:signal transduction histidine kinase